MLQYRALLKRTEDGLERWTDWADSTHPDSLIYFWTDGNYGCDCNRYLEFERAGNVPEDEIQGEPECGETLYELVTLELNDGRKMNSDQTDWKTPTF